jgi:hypothetical protein
VAHQALCARPWPDADVLGAAEHRFVGAEPGGLGQEIAREMDDLALGVQREAAAEVDGGEGATGE